MQLFDRFDRHCHRRRDRSESSHRSGAQAFHAVQGILRSLRQVDPELAREAVNRVTEADHFLILPLQRLIVLFDGVLEIKLCRLGIVQLDDPVLCLPAGFAVLFSGCLKRFLKLLDLVLLLLELPLEKIAFLCQELCAFGIALVFGLKFLHLRSKDFVPLIQLGQRLLILFFSVKLYTSLNSSCCHLYPPFARYSLKLTCFRSGFSFGLYHEENRAISL